MIMADVMAVCIWQQIGGQALVAKRPRRQCALEGILVGVRHDVVLEVLSGRAITGKSSRREGKSLQTLTFSTKRVTFTRKRMLYD